MVKRRSKSVKAMNKTNEETEKLIPSVLTRQSD